MTRTALLFALAALTVAASAVPSAAQQAKVKARPFIRDGSALQELPALNSETGPDGESCIYDVKTRALVCLPPKVNPATIHTGGGGCGGSAACGGNNKPGPRILDDFRTQPQGLEKSILQQQLKAAGSAQRR